MGVFLEPNFALRLLDDTSEPMERQQWFLQQRQRAHAVKWTRKGLEHEDELEDQPCVSDEQSEKKVSSDENTALHVAHCEGVFPMMEVSLTPSHSEVVDVDTAAHLPRSCKLVVGLHPDQATGEIAELATHLGVPWAVVPCCVYSGSFPQRRLHSGERVRTHAQLISWLCEKYVNARVASLDIDGKNQVVFVPPFGDKKK